MASTAPSLSSRLVNVAEDAELRLISLLGEHSPTLNVSQCESCSDTSELFQLILSDGSCVSAFVLQIQDDEEAVGGFALLVALIPDHDTPSTQGQVSSLAKAVMEAGAAKDLTSESASRKLKLLSVLYNLRSSVVDKLAILQSLISVASNFPSLFLRPRDPLGSLLASTEESEDRRPPTGGDRGGRTNPRQVSLRPSTPRIVFLLESWRVTAEQRFSVYDTIVRAFEKNAPDDIRKQRFLLLLIGCLPSNNKDMLTAAKDAAIGAIRDPISLFAHQRNMLHIPAVQALATSEPILFGLLNIFQEGKLSDYDAFLQKNGGQDAVLLPWGLDPLSCRRNMRILSLCSLASEHEEIPYQNIAETLQIEYDSSTLSNYNTTLHVEAQVIAAVNSGLLQAKMDQLSQKVLVERCVVRKFDLPQWVSLQSRLKAWKESVASILDAMEQAQQSVATSNTLAAAT